MLDGYIYFQSELVSRLPNLMLPFLLLEKKYVSKGCFRDKGKKFAPRPLPELIKNLRPNIDWQNLQKTIDACAEEARKKG